MSVNDVLVDESHFDGPQGSALLGRPEALADWLRVPIQDDRETDTGLLGGLGGWPLQARINNRRCSLATHWQHLDGTRLSARALRWQRNRWNRAKIGKLVLQVRHTPKSAR